LLSRLRFCRKSVFRCRCPASYQFSQSFSGYYCFIWMTVCHLNWSHGS
jgi:hypothetical protein